VLDRALACPAEHLWAFSSAQALAHLQHLAAGANWSKSRAVAAHPRVADSARRLGFGRVEVGPLTPQALAAAVQAAPAGHLQSGAP
jgi:uroporphyrinogen-III synthase